MSLHIVIASRLLHYIITYIFLRLWVSMKLLSKFFHPLWENMFWIKVNSIGSLGMPSILLYPHVENYVKTFQTRKPLTTLLKNIYMYLILSYRSSFLVWSVKHWSFFHPLFLFMHGFDKKKRHNMLFLMLDLKYKNMHLVIIYLGHEIVTTLVVDYNE
jgi:hypothetical protein